MAPVPGRVVGGTRARPAPLRRRVAALGIAAATLGPAPALGAEPFALLGGRLRLGGEVSGTISPEDEGYFNYSGYEHDELRMFRVDLSAELRMGSKAALLFDLRTDNLDAPRVYALFLRFRPWTDRELDLQAGLVPPVFGTYPRRRYGYESWLSSVPLAYQYLTSLRSDAVPANAEQLVEQRGRGWSVSYPVGNPYAGPGLPLVAGERWDAGLQLRVGREPLSLAAAVTQGALSSPRVRDDNSGKSVSARLAWTPGPAFTLGVSGSTGDFVSTEVTDVLPVGSGDSFRQEVFGADVQYARGHLIVRGEAVFSRFRLPALDATQIEEPLEALGVYGEVRYKVWPGLYVAARAEHLAFGRIPSTLGLQTWDADVTRFEAGAGYAFRRQVLLKASWQHNERDGGRVRRNDLVSVQVLLWF